MGETRPAMLDEDKGMTSSPNSPRPTRNDLLAAIMREGNDRPTAAIILDAREAAAARRWQAEHCPACSRGIGETGDACDECGPAGERQKDAAEHAPEIAAYREIRDRVLAAEKKADAAFLRWFTKLQAGEPTNAAQANRLADALNYLSADLSSAEDRLYALDIDPRDIDRADGVVSAL